METKLDKPNVMLWSQPSNVKHITRSFSEEEIKSIFKTLEESEDYYSKGGTEDWGKWLKARDICLISFIYWGAMRPKEACALKFEDIDFKKRTIFISGYNNKCRKDRIIRLSQQIYPYLEKFLSFPKRFWRNSEYFFPSFQGANLCKPNHLSPGTLKGIFREKVLKKNGLYEREKFRTRLYSLRKSRACQLLKESKDLFLVSNVLGHSDIRCTASHYVEADTEYTDYIGDVMDGNIKAQKTPQIQINQTNNITVLIQQMTLMMQQQQKQNEIILKILEEKSLKNQVVTA